MEEWPWARLADAVRRRREDLGYSQRVLGELAGTTYRMISALERAERDTYQDKTLRAVSRALGWTPDSMQRILGGEPPVEATVPPDEGVDLVAEIQALRDQMAKLTELVQESISQRAGRR